MTASKTTKRLQSLGIALVLLFATQALAVDVVRATKEEAVAFVKKAVAYLKTNGTEKAFAEFSDPKGKFIDRDLYIIAYGADGTTLAHGRNNKLVGRNRLEEQDADGAYFNKNRIELMKTQTSFWTRYKITDPITHKILPKLSYCETVEDTVLNRFIVCSGIYDAQP